MQFLNDCEVLLNARFPVDDIKDLLHLDVGETESDFDRRLGLRAPRRDPAVGATLRLGDATLTVEQVRRQSIQLVRITSPVPFLRERNGATLDEDQRRRRLTPARAPTATLSRCPRTSPRESSCAASTTARPIASSQS